MTIIKNWVHVRVAFLKNVLPQSIKYLSAYFNSISYQQVTRRNVLLLSHSLEKGFLYSTPKENWGYNKAKSLLSQLVFLLKNGDSLISYEVNEGFSVIEAYAKYTQNSVLCSEISAIKKNIL